MPAAESELDVSRLTELEGLLGTDLAAIVATLVTELTSALTRIDKGLESGDLADVAAAAHAARNSALMIDARPLLRELKQLEQCARKEDPDGATAARAHVDRAWPLLRRRLELAAGAPHRQRPASAGRRRAPP